MSDMRSNDKRTDDMRSEREMRDERRMADRPEKEKTEAMRTNPEVMGRAEPVAVNDRDRPATEPRPVGRVGGPGEVRAPNGGMEMSPAMYGFHRRVGQLQ